MHIEMEKEKCLWNLELANRITTKHQTLPVLQCVRIEVKDDIVQFLSTNLELNIATEASAKVTKPGIVAVPANLLLHTIQLIPHNTVVLRLEGDVLMVESKGSHTKIKTIPHDDFPITPRLTKDGQVINGVMFALGIKTVAFATSQSAVKPELGSVYISQKKEHSLTFVATDSFRLVEKTVPQKSLTLDAPILIPQKNAQEIARILEIVGEDPEFIVSENQVAFVFKKGVYVATRLTEGTFPDYQSIIPKEYKTHATLLVADLNHALKKTNIFANKFMQVGFAIDQKTSSVSLTSDNTDVGQTTENVHASIEGDDLTLSFNQRYVSEPLGYFTSESVVLHFAGIGRPLVIEGVGDASLRYLVMPMNK